MSYERDCGDSYNSHNKHDQFNQVNQVFSFLPHQEGWYHWLQQPITGALGADLRDMYYLHWKQS